MSRNPPSRRPAVPLALALTAAALLVPAAARQPGPAPLSPVAQAMAAEPRPPLPALLPIPLAPIAAASAALPPSPRAGSAPPHPETQPVAPAPSAQAASPGSAAPAPVASCAALRRKPWSLFHPAWRSGGAASPQWPGTGLPLVDVPALVDDPDGRIEREFRVPAYLRDRVLFWMRIHAVYSLQMRVIHDRNDLALIYGYIDFRPWLEACGPQSRTRAAEKAIVAELKQRLRAAAVTRPHRPTAPEQAALSEFLADHGVTRATDLAVLPRRVRTQTGQRDEFQAGLERAKSLLPQIEVLFAQNGLPRTLARIPFVESSFNPRAHSRAGAFGIWQFMPHTARQYINKRDHTRWVDPLQQTVSAIGFLERTRVRLPDWSTTITAYNSGVGRMRRLVRKYGVRNIGGLLAQPSRASLGFAGKNFYAQVLSANLVEAYQEELFRGRLEPADYVAVLHHTNPPQRTARLPGPTTPRMSAGHTLPE